MKEKKSQKKRFKAAPLDSAFMATSIIGFFVSIWFVMRFLSFSWGFAFATLFVLMFLASLISMTRADVETNHIDALAMHELRKKK